MASRNWYCVHSVAFPANQQQWSAFSHPLISSKLAMAAFMMETICSPVEWSNICDKARRHPPETSVFVGTRSPSTCKWIDAARLSKIGRARNSSKYGDKGFFPTFADLEIATIKSGFEQRTDYTNSSSNANSSTSCKLLRSAGTRVVTWTLKVEELYSASDVTTLVRAARPTSLVLGANLELREAHRTLGPTCS